MSNSTVPPNGKLHELKAYLEGKTLVVLLLSGYTYTGAEEFISDVVANELVSAGYARQTVAGAAFSLDATNAKMGADDVLFSGISTGSITHAVLAINTGSDATSGIVGFLNIIYTFNGTTLTLRPDTTGLYRVE